MTGGRAVARAAADAEELVRNLGRLVDEGTLSPEQALRSALGWQVRRAAQVVREGAALAERAAEVTPAAAALARDLADALEALEG